MGVAWFQQHCPTTTNGRPASPISRSPSLNRINNNHRRNSTLSKLEDTVDVIDIEDEDHSFAAFFIGMKTGPSPYVKRPLVYSYIINRGDGGLPYI
jgi:hypothetical protein